MKDFVSLIIPVYNEEKYIKNCIDSLLLQVYPKEKMEWIFVDGCSCDNTKKILNEYKKLYPNLIYIFDNPNKTVPYAMNIGIEESSGKYIIRLDAHADYYKDYISKCVWYLITTKADNVGGMAETKSSGLVGASIALMLSSKFGVGNSQFRISGSSGYVDTVPFGAFRREVFEKWGGYDERLIRNQDNEMNYRIRKNGGKIYLADDIRFSYYCRDSIKGISDMAMKNGMWNVITMKLCPGSMGMRHFIPFVFFLSIVLLPIFSVFVPAMAYFFICEMVLYFTLALISSFKLTKKIKQVILIFMLFPIFHISYGYGSLKGFFEVIKKKYNN